METKSIETMLEEEILDNFECLKEMEAGTDEYKTTTQELSKLMDKAIELKKLDIEVEEKAKNREHESKTKLEQIEFEYKLKEVDRLNEMRLKEEQLKIDKKHKWLDLGLKGLTFVGGTLLTIWGVNRTLKFDETETITSSMGRGFVNSLFPKNKF